MAIPGVPRALACCRQLTSHFHRSTTACYVLKRKQIDLHSPQYNLTHNVVKRLNSYYMVERVVELQQLICAALLELKRGEMMSSDTAFAALSDYLAVMKPLVQITKGLGWENWVTITMVRPLLHKLFNVHLQSSSSDSNLKKSVKVYKTLKNSFKSSG